MAAKWLGLGYLLCLVAASLLMLLNPFEPIDLFFMAFSVLWISSPMAVVYLLVAISRSRAGAWAFVVLEILLIIATFLLLLDMALDRSKWSSVGSSFALMFWPFLQGIAITIFFLVALPLGWRAKESWVRN